MQTDCAAAESLFWSGTAAWMQMNLIIGHDRDVTDQEEISIPALTELQLFTSRVCIDSETDSYAYLGCSLPLRHRVKNWWRRGLCVCVCG